MALEQPEPHRGPGAPIEGQFGAVTSRGDMVHYAAMVGPGRSLNDGFRLTGDTQTHPGGFVPLSPAEAAAHPGSQRYQMGDDPQKFVQDMKDNLARQLGIKPEQEALPQFQKLFRDYMKQIQEANKGKQPGDLLDIPPYHPEQSAPPQAPPRPEQPEAPQSRQPHHPRERTHGHNRGGRPKGHGGRGHGSDKHAPRRHRRPGGHPDQTDDTATRDTREQTQPTTELDAALAAPQGAPTNQESSRDQGGQHQTFMDGHLTGQEGPAGKYNLGYKDGHLTSLHVEGTAGLNGDWLRAPGTDKFVLAGADGTQRTATASMKDGVLTLTEIPAQGAQPAPTSLRT